MRIAMIGDTAFVGSTIKRMLRDKGFQFMNFEFDSLSRKLLFANTDTVELIPEIDHAVLEKIRQFKPDIIHVHFYYHLVPLLSKIYDAKIILSLHGTELRTGGWHTILSVCGDMVTHYTVSTRDLLDMEDQPDNCTLMLNTFDPVIIQGLRAQHTVPLHLFIKHGHFNNEGGFKCANFDPREHIPFIQNRAGGELYPRISYPHFLAHFSVLHDHKVVGGKTLGLSLTGIEFLSMGGIYCTGDELYTSLPEEYDATVIKGKWKELYNIVSDTIPLIHG